ncbi:hypothetical protein CMO88_01315 [Candidatus Woesearchaeota archaeon]|nr:hypothetical protein [Candidatus Woesearchaeota archaeon]|tara:strand:- start:13894 stop:14691 length:798 start_codon:yes stop_codon:yes gene_type:complete
MKSSHWIILLTITSVFLITFLISSGTLTGFLTFSDDSINLEIERIEVYDTRAIITWSTKIETISVLNINDENIAFQEATKFRKELVGLEPGTSYEYNIKACTGHSCEEKNEVLVTKGGSAETKETGFSPITGLVAGVDGAVNVLQTSATYILFWLIGIVVLVISARIGYEKFSNRNQMAGMINKTKKLINMEQYEEANQTYAAARQAFLELEEDAKLKHYDDLLRIYHNLKKRAELIEAQKLAEKYTNETITQDELRMLNNLLSH